MFRHETAPLRKGAAPFLGVVVEGAGATVRAGRASSTWLVTNGHAVVGPVSLSALLRGIERGAIGPDCLLRQPAWAAWRGLQQVREVRAWFRGDSTAEDEPESWLERAGDRGELLHCALLAGLAATSATWGAGYGRRNGRWYRTCVVGGAANLLGQRVRETDPVFPWLEAGAIYLGEVARGSSVARALCGRSGCPGDLRGVALVPLRAAGRPLGWFELGRRDHPFRGEDDALLSRIVLGVRART